MSTSGYRLVDSREVCRVGFLGLHEEGFESPTGDHFLRWRVEHPGAVAAVPVVDGPGGPEVLLVRQFRPAVREWVLEIPAGKLDVDGEEPAAAMARELAEEIEFQPGRLVELARFWNSPGFSTELTYVYIALDLSPCARPEAAKEEEQDMTIERLPLADAGRLLAAGGVTDAKTLIGLSLAETFLSGGHPRTPGSAQEGGA